MLYDTRGPDELGNGWIVIGLEHIRAHIIRLNLTVSQKPKVQKPFAASHGTSGIEQDDSERKKLLGLVQQPTHPSASLKWQ